MSFGLHHQSKETQWVPPEELVSTILNETETQRVIDASNAEYDHERYLESKVRCWLKLNVFIVIFSLHFCHLI